MSQVPAPLRAALGLVAVGLDNAKSLTERAVELPVLAVSTAMQAALRAQQRYAELTTRGDEFLAWLRGIPEEPPEWATFDEPPADGGTVVDADASAKATRPRTARTSAFDAVDEADLD